MFAIKGLLGLKGSADFMGFIHRMVFKRYISFGFHMFEWFHGLFGIHALHGSTHIYILRSLAV